MNIRRILGLLSLSTCLMLSNSGLVRSQDENRPVSRTPITKKIGNYTVKLKSCGWSQDNIICRFSFSNKTKHSTYKVSVSDNNIAALPRAGYRSSNSNADFNLGNSLKSKGSLYNAELSRIKTYEMNVFIPRVPDNTTAIRMEIMFVDYDQVPVEMKFKFGDISLSSSNSSSITPEPTGETTSSSNTASDICPNSENQLIKAETRNFELYICGGNRPVHYIGRAKDGGNSITLPLSSQSPSKFVAKNANVRYTLTREFLTVTEDGRTILKEGVSNWTESER